MNSVQTRPGAHPASSSVDNEGSIPGGKQPGVKLTTHLHLVEVKYEWSYTSTPPHASTVRWLIK
jgi:hypothetical protein